MKRKNMGATMGKSGGNLLDSLPSTQGTLHVVMLGLDSAGKTTALYRLKFDQYLNAVPTIGFNCEKVRGACGKAKGASFLVWDVGGQEKLRPLWRSYTRCTDGIVFVVDSVDVERMEEAKMELMRTAKCPDNQGVPVLILANKQDLPGAREPKELEKLLSLHELLPVSTGFSMNALSTSQPLPLQQQSSTTQPPPSTMQLINNLSDSDYENRIISTTSATVTTATTQSITNTSDHNLVQQSFGTSGSSSCHSGSYTSTNYHNNNKGWFIQPACAITGEGLQEGLEALYEMIIKKRKFNKTSKRKR